MMIEEEMRSLLRFSITISIAMMVIFFVVQIENIQAENNDISSLKMLYQRSAEIPYPDDNPFSQEKYHLGKILFFDKNLSGNKRACASCHQPNHGWSDGLPRAINAEGKQARRKTMSLLNLAWDEFYLWDGRASSLEIQALGPFSSPLEMNRPIHLVVDAVASSPIYQDLFIKAFPDEDEPIHGGTIAKAIATFERGIISPIAPFDEWVMGDEEAISEQAKQGFVLFNGKANCSACHSGWRFTDADFHDIGIADTDIGRGAHVADPKMLHAFKTLGLRDIMKRAPYMHNGSLPDMMAVFDHYDTGFIVRDSLAKEMKPLFLTMQERLELIAFLQTLTSPLISNNKQ